MTPAHRFAPPAMVAAALAAAGLVALTALLASAALVAADSPAPGSGAPAASTAPTATTAPAQSTAPAASGPAASGGTQIQIIQKTFQPADVTVHVGDTVTWTVTQAIDQAHSVTSGSYKDPQPGQLFDSGIKLKNNGDHFSYTFQQAGTFTYFCAVHPDTMSGTITVVAANGGSTSDEGGIPVENKLIAAGVLIVALLLFFGLAAVYRRMNPER